MTADVRMYMRHCPNVPPTATLREKSTFMDCTGTVQGIAHSAHVALIDLFKRLGVLSLLAITCT
jgi:hypothetical protein